MARTGATDAPAHDLLQWLFRGGPYHHPRDSPETVAMPTRPHHTLLAALTLTTVIAAAHAAEPIAPTLPTDAAGWQALTLRDLEATRALLQSQTPIPFDTENPAYPQWLEAGYAEARARAASVTDQAGAFYTVSAYLNGFNDPHIDLSPIVDLPPARWPGFIVSAKGEHAVVVHSDAAGGPTLPLGAEILACDGQSLTALASARVFPFVLNARLPADGRRAVTRLFLDRGIPFAPAPSRCTVRESGTTREETLAWRALPSPDTAFWQAYTNAGTGPGADWGVSEPAAGVVWVGVPSFNPGKDTAPKLQALVDDLEARGDALRNARAIIIDTRGNGGGSTHWANAVAEAIFTRQVLRRAEARVPDRRTAVDWRPSPENVAYWHQMRVELKDQLSASDRMQLASLIKGLEDAVAEGKTVWRMGPARVDASGGLTRLRPRDQPAPFKARVLMLSNGSCVSACLDFADRVLMVPGVQLVGSATSGDGPYMEVRSEPLPSGLAQVTFPQKVYRGMGRGTLEFYPADRTYDGAWDDASVRAWVLGLLDQAP